MNSGRSSAMNTYSVPQLWYGASGLSDGSWRTTSRKSKLTRYGPAMARIARRSRSCALRPGSCSRRHASTGSRSSVTGTPRVVAPRGLGAFSPSGQAKVN